MIKSIIFDLDGTLTNTLSDLCNSVNFALRSMGWRERSLDEVRRFVGNGVRRLIRRAVPENTSEVYYEKCFSFFRQHYLLHCQDNTCLYPGVGEMLQEVHARGFKTAIVSNKLQAGVDELYESFFRGVIDVAVGQREGVALKPASDMVEIALKQLGTSKEETIYVGDSEVDALTAHNASLPFVAVLWGFRDREQIVEAGATRFISHPKELLSIINN